MWARRVLTVIMCIFLGLVVACGQPATETKPKKIKIAGAGATFPYPLYKKWIEAYQKAHQDLSIFYDPVGSGEGIRRFVKQEVDFGASDAAMSDAEMAKVQRKVKLIPATAGIVVLAYNLPGVTGVLQLPREVYVGIFAGDIRKWDDPRIKQANQGLNLPSLNIIPVTRTDGSGTTYAFTNHLSAVSKDWRDRGPGVGKIVRWPAQAMSARWNEGVAGRVKITEGAIGYLEYSYAQRGGLAMAALENKAGKFIAPSPKFGQATLVNTQNDMPPNLRMFFPDPPGENSYPIVTYSWILLYGNYPDQKKAKALKDFVKWGITDGQDFSEDLGFCSLPPRIRELGLKALNEIQ
ncbi:MAG: phosphate ABC transporter substrate-binding protein PstS [Thermodesulfobacteriota bacterium]